MARVANFSAGEIAGRKSPGGAVGRTPENSLDKFSRRLNDIDQYLRKNSLLLHGLLDLPVKTYGLQFSEYIINKLKQLLPTIADKLKVEDIDVSHPLRTKSNRKSCVIIKFVRRDIKKSDIF